jgi:hypothetical protein
MANTIIKLKNSGAIGNVPTILYPGELAINYGDGKLYYGNSSNSASLFNTDPHPVGLNQEIQFNDFGIFGSSANLKFNSSTKTLTTDNIVVTGNITSNIITRIGGVSNSAFGQANLAFDKANSANSLAQSAYDKANSASGIVYSSTPPDFPTVGLQWVNIDTGIKYDYTNDGDTYQWIELGPTTVAVPVVGYTTQVVFVGTTSDNIEKEIFINGINNNRIRISGNTTSYYTIDVVARRTDGPGESGSFFLKATAANNSGTISDVGSVYEVVVARDDVGFTIDARANNTTKSINIYVTGVTGKTLNWKAVVTTLEV